MHFCCRNIHWECSIQWSQQIRAVVLKWLISIICIQLFYEVIIDSHFSVHEPKYPDNMFCLHGKQTGYQQINIGGKSCCLKRVACEYQISSKQSEELLSQMFELRTVSFVKVLIDNRMKSDMDIRYQSSTLQLPGLAPIR